MVFSKTIPIKHIKANEVDSLVSMMVPKRLQDVKGVTTNEAVPPFTSSSTFL